MPNNLTYIDEHGLLGSNYYWRKGLELGLPKEQLAQAGLTDERVRVHPDIIEPLKAADVALQKQGYRLYISEGYRSPELYRLVGEMMAERIGTESRDRILNLADMPHATGRTVDAALFADGKKMTLRDRADGLDAYFVDFYKGKNEHFHRLQQLLIETMQDAGFRLGKRREYFHFNYKPYAPRTY